MSRAIALVSVVVVFAALLGGCGDDDAEEAEPTTTTSTTEAVDDDAAAIADAEDALEAQGFSEAGARCLVESVVDRGVPVEDLERIDAFDPGQQLMDAFANAGVECASEIAGDIPEGLVDLEDPRVREQFVRTFAESTGVSTEVADCVAQHLIDNDIDYDALIAAAGGAAPDEDTQRLMSEAFETCA